MTAFDGFDPFARRVSEAIDEIAVARVPDYLTDVLRQTARASQRPRWSFPERWIPVDTALSRPTVFGQLRLRQLIVLGLLVALAAVALVVAVGTQKRPAPAFGPAANGALMFEKNDDIYLRNPTTGEQRVLIGGEGRQFAPSFSPDGQLVAYATASSEGDHFMVANADGTNPRQLALIPSAGNAQGAWAPDSKTVGFIYDVTGSRSSRS